MEQEGKSSETHEQKQGSDMNEKPQGMEELVAFLKAHPNFQGVTIAGQFFPNPNLKK